MKGIKDLAFDTTGIGYFECAKGYTPDPAALTELLAKNRMKKIHVTAAKEIELPKTVACYEVTIAGLA